MQKQYREILIPILLGGIVAATIDIFVAAIMYSQSPGRILQSIAGGLVGKATFDGGMQTIILGAILQEAMGVLIAATYVVVMYAVVKSLPALRGRWILAGLASGVVIYFVMGYIVLPLSALKATPHFSWLKFAKEIPAMLLFGLIVAFFCRRLPVSVEPAKGEAASPA